MAATRRAPRPSPARSGAPPQPPRHRRRAQTVDEGQAQAALARARAELTNCETVRAKRKAFRDEAAQALARHNEMLAHDIDQCATWARTIAAIETQLAAAAPAALADVIRRRIRAWVAWRQQTVLRTVNIIVAADLAGLEPQLVALAPALATIVRRYPQIGRTLESLFDELLACRRLDAMGWTESSPDAAVLTAAFQSAGHSLS